MLDSTDAFRTGFFFEPLSSQPLYFWHQFNRSQQEVLITLESRQGDRLQGRVKILQAPTGEVNCPALLPSDFSDQQKLEAAYQCLVDAGLRIEISLQFKDYSVTLPVLLSTESDYAAVEEAMRQIASRADPSFKEVVQAFEMAFMNDETIQALGQCLLGQVTQPSSTQMVPLYDCRAVGCMGCTLGVGGMALGFVALFFTGGTVAGAYAAIGALYGGAMSGALAMGTACSDCIRGCGGSGGNDQPPPPPSGGGCSQCSYR
jgi:hypothetical protein